MAKPTAAIVTSTFAAVDANAAASCDSAKPTSDKTKKIPNPDGSRSAVRTGES